ncbi:MAG: N-formylglutamate amidohydrolase [Chroococcidiopsidaceae cyanobacterium CP_BM_ER_R8_30]|nr:N-formylglutamate amidohydrolase [Chroococcidiopsidaceae cyanobacterium CP_BM_ER_R8_30]
MALSDWVLIEGNGPIVAVALHDGHAVRQEVAALFALDESERRREEDPFTANWTTVGDTRIVVQRSRFEFDLNRPREKAVYLKPEDAWGLTVWHSKLSQEILARSLAEYDAFYAAVKQVFTDLEQRFGRFVVYDLHTYNHRRLGLEALPADPMYNPEINLGTGTMDRSRWAPVVESFLTDLCRFDFLGRQLDVRENIKFHGGYFQYWVHQTFPRSACVLSVEVKKFFMNEWSNELDMKQLDAIRSALKSTVPGVLNALKQV